MKEIILKSNSLNERTTVSLPNELKEISGLEWVGENQVWAVRDESGEIFQIGPKTGDIIQKMRLRN